MTARVPLFLILAGFLAVGCQRQDAPEAGVTDAGTSSAPSITRLPLTPGFYVTADTPCNEASNATLMLVHESGINAARTACSHEYIEQTGQGAYRVRESCVELGGWGGDAPAEERTVIYRIVSDTAYEVAGEGWKESMRLCAQNSLPEPWREIDLSEGHP